MDHFFKFTVFIGSLKAKLHFYLHTYILVVIKCNLILFKLCKLWLDVFFKKAIGLHDLEFLLLDQLFRLLAFRAIYGCTTSFLNQAKNLGRFHIDDLCDSALHYEEMRIVYIKLYALEKITNSFSCLGFAVDVALDFLILNGARD